MSKIHPGIKALQVAIITCWLGAAVFVILPWSLSAPGRGQPRARAVVRPDKQILVALEVHAEPDRAVSARVLLLGPDGEVLQRLTHKVPASRAPSTIAFAFKQPDLPWADITVRCWDGLRETEAPLSAILLFKGHETSLSAPADLVAGSPLAFRCAVHGVRSITETVPLAASVEVTLLGPGKTVHRVFTGKLAARAETEVRCQVPDVAAGKYHLEVHTKSALGEEKLRREVLVRPGGKVHLTTDKPLYQPGQTIHLRALALHTFDLKPIAKAALSLEVEDGKGNKVFKKALETSAHGIAHADFILADEVNMGTYRIRALLGDLTTEKTVEVKRYVLPKFKTELRTDKTFYLPNQTIEGDLQADYLFGKPITGATVEIKAGTVSGTFKEFATWKGKTNAGDLARFSLRLPAWLSGRALQKGSVPVRLEAKVTDLADHVETSSLTVPVSDKPIELSFIIEGGRLVPDLENRIFVAALYPDGKPANCTIDVWRGRVVKGKRLATLRTNDTGLAELRLTPTASQFRFLKDQSNQQGKSIHALDLTALVRDAVGNRTRLTAQLTGEPGPENVLLRLDKAIYKEGDAFTVDLRSSAGLTSASLEVIKAGQTMLTRLLEVKDGKFASSTLKLPPGVFGTLEVHACQRLISGEIIRDARVIYVDPARELNIKISADKPEYRPGAEGTISFEVTDAGGKPAPAALGVLIVDEAVYALQEMQPGLEKVYFTLQKELVAPTITTGFKPGESVETILRAGKLTAERQQMARVLLAAIQPKGPARWDVTPAADRKEQIHEQISAIGWSLFEYARSSASTVVAKGRANQYRFRANLLETLVKSERLEKSQLTDSLSGKVTLERLAQLEPGFSADRLAEMVTRARMEDLVGPLQNRYAKRAKWFSLGTDALLERMLVEAALLAPSAAVVRKDGWGRDMKLIKRSLKEKKKTGLPGLTGFSLVSAGPDGVFGTEDDIGYEPCLFWEMPTVWWKKDATHLLAVGIPVPPGLRALMRDFNIGIGLGGRWGIGALGGGLALGGFGGLPPGGLMGGAGLMMGMAGGPMGRVNLGVGGGLAGAGLMLGGLPGGAQRGRGRPLVLTLGKSPAAASPGTGPPARMREYFPETLLWQPALITDDAGRATLKVPFADSITTWRLTASASSRAGGLGGISAPLRVFQDFFVDLDLPVALTQNDEVAFPVAVYNYLKEPHKVTLELKQEPWFDLVDSQGAKRTLQLEPNQVTSVKFRIRARKVGRFSLTLDARGARISDASRRTIEVLPDGVPVERVHSDRLAGTVNHTISIPKTAIDGASRLLVKVYPGIYSQLLEGVEGMLRMPHGCFEQTSSSAYPNILAIDYLKKNRLATLPTLVVAEGYLAAGYQRLLTFERPGGGFDLWGKGPPDVWLSAYGLQEFNDMARVWPIDGTIIERTRNWLLKQQAADGTWSRGSDPKLLLTCYVTWALLDSTPKTAGWQKSEHGKQLRKAIEYIREQAAKSDNAYVLALAANALVSWDADGSKGVLQKVLIKLNNKRERITEWKAVRFPAKGQSVCYAYGDGMLVETTALAALALARSGQFTDTVNQALTYLTRMRGSDGTWGSTHPTVLALKALLAAVGTPHKGTTPFTIKVNGKEVASGKVTESTSDVLQQFDLREHLETGDNQVSIAVKGKTSLLYQVVGRHFEPRADKAVKPAEKPVLEVAVAYDRTKLTTADLLKAKATLRYNGKMPAYQVIVDLPIPPGFTVAGGDFAKLVASRKVMRFGMTARQVTLYVGDVKSGSEHVFEYTLKPKYPIKAKAPAAVAYEYYTPANRGSSVPVALVVEDKK